MFLPGDFTWPTRLPRHAACVSSQQSKPVRPLFLGGREATPQVARRNHNLSSAALPGSMRLRVAADYFRPFHRRSAAFARAVVLRRCDFAIEARAFLLPDGHETRGVASQAARRDPGGAIRTRLHRRTSAAACDEDRAAPAHERVMAAQHRGAPHLREPVGTRRDDAAKDRRLRLPRAHRDKERAIPEQSLRVAALRAAAVPAP